jgi:SHS2 domain-containing protein
MRYRSLGGDPRRVIVVGATCLDLFENAAIAMFDQAFEIGGVPPTYSRPIVAPGDSFAELMANWLAEVLYVAETERLVWSSFAIDRLEEGGIQGSASGMPLDSVAMRDVMVAGLAGPPGDPVPVPEGWWCEIAFALVPRIGGP